MLERGYSKDRRRGNRLRASGVSLLERIIDDTAAPTRNASPAAAGTITAGPTHARTAGNTGSDAGPGGKSGACARHRHSGAGHDALAYADISDRLIDRIRNGECGRCSP